MLSKLLCFCYTVRMHFTSYVNFSFVDVPPMTWFEAKEHCEKEGGNLVEIDSEDENRALVEEINKRGYTERQMHFWMGLTDLEVDGDWRLASNAQLVKVVNRLEADVLYDKNIDHDEKKSSKQQL